MTRFSWTQPCCLMCWYQRNRGRQPVQLAFPDAETCVYCGHATVAGVYIRIDPKEAPHPTLTKS